MNQAPILHDTWQSFEMPSCLIFLLNHRSGEVLLYLRH